MSQTTVSGKGHPDLAPAPIRAEQAVGSRSALAVFAASLAVAMLLAAGLRLYQLPRASFWADELYSVESIVYQREHPLELWRFASHLPVRLGLWASGAEIDRARIDRPEDWRSLGIHETSTRIGPAIVGILTVPLLGLASLRLLGPRGASVLMILLAVSPWHLYWSQNARFYILLFLFYNLALILYYLGSRHQSRPHLVAGMVFAVVAYLIHPPAIFLFAILAADWLVAHLRGRPVPLGQAGRLAVTLALGACQSAAPVSDATPPAAAASAPAEAPLILVSIDGFRHDYRQKAPTPTLDRLVEEGVRAERLVPVFPTLTFPNHYSLVTGLHPEEHGIVG
ncbi:MAG: alkaline phosphatase family protein, partial [Phycisphaeraceae bacterium]